jgi:hypothetical protein
MEALPQAGQRKRKERDNTMMIDFLATQMLSTATGHSGHILALAHGPILVGPENRAACDLEGQQYLSYS